MNVESLFKGVQNVGELEAACLQHIDASEQISEIADSVSNTVKYLADKAVTFYNNLVSAHLDLPLCAAIATHVSKLAAGNPQIKNTPIETLPTTVRKIVDSASARPDKAQLELTLFFNYLGKDPDYLKGTAQTYEQKIMKFRASIERLRSYFKREASEEYPHLTRDGYQMNLSTRDVAYRQNWDNMITDLSKRYDAELAKPETQQDAHRIKELRRTIYDCKQIKRFEKQEKIDLAKLAKMGSMLYEAIDL